MLRGFLVLAFPLLTAPVLSSSQVRHSASDERRFDFLPLSVKKNTKI